NVAGDLRGFEGDTACADGELAHRTNGDREGGLQENYLANGNILNAGETEAGRQGDAIGIDGESGRSTGLDGDAKARAHLCELMVCVFHEEEDNLELILSSVGGGDHALEAGEA